VGGGWGIPPLLVKGKGVTKGNLPRRGKGMLELVGGPPPKRRTAHPAAPDKSRDSREAG